MVRVSSSVTARRRKKRVLAKTKGQFLKRSTNYRHARKGLIKALQYAYRDRRAKKRDFRKLWIVRIKAACEEAGIAYSRFIKGIHVAKISLNRKMLAEIAVSAPDAFRRLVETAKTAKAS